MTNEEEILAKNYNFIYKINLKNTNIKLTKVQLLN